VQALSVEYSTVIPLKLAFRAADDVDAGVFVEGVDQGRGRTPRIAEAPILFLVAGLRLFRRRRGLRGEALDLDGDGQVFGVSDIAPEAAAKGGEDVVSVPCPRGRARR